MCRPCIGRYYLTDQRLTAARALMLGLVHAVCVGVCSAKESARRAAGYVGVQRQAVTDARCSVDARLLEEEAFSHMECQHINSGFITTAGVQHALPIPLTTLALPSRGNMPARWPLVFFLHDGPHFDGSSRELPPHLLQVVSDHAVEKPVIAIMCRRDVCLNHSLPLWPIGALGSAAELRVEELRLSCCLNADVVPVHEAKLGGAAALFATALSIDEANGVAVLEPACMVPTLEAALSLLLRLGPALRAIALDIAGAGDPAIAVRTSGQMRRALDAMHALSVPIVCSADGKVGRGGMAAWLAADHRVIGTNWI